jgi:hypothetical protein
MSASEKLKALDEALLIFGSGPDWIDLDGPKAGTAVVRLKRTLPQIAAVVEALTLIADHGHEMDDYELPPKQARKIARAALAALDEALPELL